MNRCIIETKAEFGIFKCFHCGIEEKYGKGYAWHDAWPAVVKGIPSEVYSYVKGDKTVYRVVDLCYFKTSYFDDSNPLVEEKITENTFCEYGSLMIFCSIEKGKASLKLMLGEERICSIEEARRVFWFYCIKHNLIVMHRNQRVYPEVDKHNKLSFVSDVVDGFYLWLDERNRMHYLSAKERPCRKICEAKKLVLNNPEGGFDYYHYDGVEIWKSKKGVVNHSLAKKIAGSHKWDKAVSLYEMFIPVVNHETNEWYWLVGNTHLAACLLSMKTCEIGMYLDHRMWGVYSPIPARHLTKEYYE